MGWAIVLVFFYEKPVHPITSKMPCYTPSVVSQLQSELKTTKTELNSTKNELQQQRTSMEEQQRQLEQQQSKLEEPKKMMEEQQRMLEAQCKMMEDQKKALLGFQSQMALMSSLLGHHPNSMIQKSRLLATYMHRDVF